MSSKKDRRSRVKREAGPPLLDDDFSTPAQKGDKTPIKPKNVSQRLYQNAIRTSPVPFGIGPAGTGKTFIAVAEACDLLVAKKIERILVTRPAVEAGESLGFLPGEMEEKFDPYFAPVRDIMVKRLGLGPFEYHLRKGTIIAKPLAFMRGVTFEDAFVLFDEAQNATPKQMKLFLTRIGERIKVVIDGDETQMDIPGQSGLMDAVRRFGGLAWAEVIEFTTDDIVRSGIARDVVLGYSDLKAA